MIRATIFKLWKQRRSILIIVNNTLDLLGANQDKDLAVTFSYMKDIREVQLDRRIAQMGRLKPSEKARLDADIAAGRARHRDCPFTTSRPGELCCNDPSFCTRQPKG